MGYPPDHHLLRDLCVRTFWPGELESRFVAPLVPQIAAPDGSMATGALFAVVDLAAASTAIAAADDGWAGTLDLSVRLAGRVVDGPLIVEGQVIRAGGTLIAVKSELYDGHGDDAGGEFVGTTIGSFRRMRRNAEFNAGPAQRHEVGVWREYARSDSGFARSLIDTIGLVEHAPGHVELEKSPYVTNSFGTINGGTTGIVICAGAESAVGPGWMATDVDVRYIGQAGAGPVRTLCEVLRVGVEHAVVDVTVIDLGEGRRAVAAGSVTLLAESSSPVAD